MHTSNIKYGKKRLEAGKPVYALSPSSGAKHRVIEIVGEKARTVYDKWIQLDGYDLTSG